MRLLRYVSKRLLFLFPQLLGISILTFLRIRLLPGNPANVMAGGFATEETIARIEERLGLNEPIHIQYLIYLKNVAGGDFGTSWYTSNPVLVDFQQRISATLELITISMVIALLIGIPVGAIAAVRTKGVADRIVFFYSLLAGSLPDFWLGLILIFFLYYKLSWLPAPIGRIALAVAPPDRITGMYVLDSLLTQNWVALSSSVKHLIMPVMTLVLVYMAPIIKMTRSSMEEVIQSDFVAYMRASGLRNAQVMRQALRNALPPIVTIIAVLYGYLISGAVLVEAVFGWGGLGQYAVQSINNSDFAPIQAFVLVTATFMLVLYLLVDVVYFLLDPRIRA